MSIRGYRGVLVKEWSPDRFRFPYRLCFIRNAGRKHTGHQRFRSRHTRYRKRPRKCRRSNQRSNQNTQFTNEGEVSLRAGSWGLFRPTFDVQSVLDKNQTIAFRMNGAFERSDNYRPVIHSNHVYINPSLEWRPG